MKVYVALRFPVGEVQAMKRLVVCCDGTWDSVRGDTVTNIVKIGEAVLPQTTLPDGRRITQTVFTADGAGTEGFLADKLLGGAFGDGVSATVSTLYWQLALNWEPGDEIYLFGFSRGAYTARSVAGMIHRLGLLTGDAMIRGVYRTALDIYRQPKPAAGQPDPPEWADFRAANAHYPVPIHFLGVFDTVGALGVPGVTARHYRFHDVELSPNVRRARQALAIDERRRAYEPCLWTVPPGTDPTADPGRVKQVWFEGGHGDIGGGNPDTRLSDHTLRWMVTQATESGLDFCPDRMAELFAAPATPPAEPPTPHDGLTSMYLVTNAFSIAARPGNPRFYHLTWRNLDLPGDNTVSLSATVPAAPAYDPPNLRHWRAQDIGIPIENTEQPTQFAPAPPMSNEVTILIPEPDAAPAPEISSSTAESPTD